MQTLQSNPNNNPHQKLIELVNDNGTGALKMLYSVQAYVRTQNESESPDIPHADSAGIVYLLDILEAQITVLIDEANKHDKLKNTITQFLDEFNLDHLPKEDSISFVKRTMDRIAKLSNDLK